MSLIILSYNVKMLNPLIFKSRQRDRAQLIGRIIRDKMDFVDVVVFQELFDDEAENVMDKMLKEFHRSKKVGDDKVKTLKGLKAGKLDDGGVKIYSRHPIKEQKLITFSESSKDDALAHKGAIRVKINKKGKDFYIIGTHIQSGKKEKEKGIKLTQFKEIQEKLLSGIKNEPHWIVGDFNIDFHGQKDLLNQVLDITDMNVSKLVDGLNTTAGDTDMLKVDGSNPSPKLLDFGLHNNTKSSDKKVISIISQQGIKLPREKKGGVFGRVFTKQNRILVNDLSDHRPILIYGRSIGCDCPPNKLEKLPHTFADTEGVKKKRSQDDLEQRKRDLIIGGAEFGVSVIKTGKGTKKRAQRKFKRLKKRFL